MTGAAAAQQFGKHHPSAPSASGVGVMGWILIHDVERSRLAGQIHECLLLPASLFRPFTPPVLPRKPGRQVEVRRRWISAIQGRQELLPEYFVQTEAVRAPRPTTTLDRGP